MATRIPTRDDPAALTPDPATLAELRQLVDALPDDLAAWTYTNSKGNSVVLPAAMAFLEKVCLSAYLAAQSCWPDREMVWKWLMSPCRSLAGPGGPPSTYETYAAFLAPRREIGG